MKDLRKFIRYYKPYRTVFYLDLLCAMVISLIDLAFPQALRYLTQTLFQGSAERIMRTLPFLAAVFFAAYIVQALCRYYVGCQGHVMGAKMERDMRQELFEHYEQLSFSYYDRNNTGQMMSKLVSDLFDISEMAHHGPENLFISLIKLAGSFVFLFLTEWKLALILLAIAMTMFVVCLRQNETMQETFMDNRRKIGDINAALNDSLSGIRVVQAFANEDLERVKFEKGNEAFLQSKKRNYKAMGRFQSTTTFFIGMMYLATLVFGGWFVARGDMTPGDLAIAAIYIGIFVSPIQILVELTEMLQKGFSGFRRFRAVIEAQPEIVDQPGAGPLPNPEGDIVFHDVSFEYTGEEEVLHHISLTIPRGQSVALVGPSGGGKSTVCSLIPRFYDVSAGMITIGGTDIRTVSLQSLRQNIGIVQQDVYLFSGTIRENISYGKPDATDEEIRRAASLADLEEFIESLPDGYDTYVGERGTRLSGGQKQRISIARIFLRDPKILILDEATSALDNESERYIQKSLDRLSKGRTTITIAHRLSTIRGADQIYVIVDGKVSERGTHEELTGKVDGIYARYCRLSVS
ncbi:MAG TPA: thiamine ABC transporter permease [Lachnospiraceae bacterium]|nr:thiamine ABC transporter permease [Lachnospiraceae bacterium]HAP72357.1 thiamine ABC transporter permease [Lachnospiraceae bacterium]